MMEGRLIIALHALPFDILAAVLNPLLQSVCVNSQIILMKLPQPDGDAAEYMKNQHPKVKDLPPILLMNSSTHLPVITRYISPVCLNDRGFVWRYCWK